MTLVRRALVLASSMVLAVAGCGGPQPTDRATPLADLAWLVGRWTTLADGDLVTIEQWSAARDGTMSGHGETREGGQITHSEELRIEARDDGTVVYVASPVGQATTEFVRITRAGQVLEVRAPEHDFPVSIRYERRGDALDARVEGRDGDGFDVHFVRAPE